MGLENIIEKINKEASLKAEEILKEARGKEEEIISSAEKEAEKIRENMLKEALQKQSRSKESALALANLEARKELLRYKQSIVSRVYDEILQDIEKLSSEEYQDFIENILLKYASGDEEVIIASGDEKRLTKKFIDRVNKKLSANKKKGNLIISDQKRTFTGGVILRKGKLEANYSFGNLIKNLRDKTEQEAVKILFASR